jgi:hypothetical protein
VDKIIVLIDYNTVFGSKYDSIPYRRGMDKELLKNYFAEKGFEAEFIQFAEVNHYDTHFWKGRFVIYTSSEDKGYHYKSFIEDIIYYLELCGAILIPSFKYLRANNNKVFMELLRKRFINRYSRGIDSEVFGCLEEMQKFISSQKFPVVFKQSAGAMSEGVGIGLKRKDLISKIKNISRTPFPIEELKDFLRQIRHSGYKKESKFRKKFILQEFIPSLKGDYKVLIFSNKYYVLQRGVRHNDFRASGSGIRNYSRVLPEGLLEFSKEFFQCLDVPNASLDIAFDGNTYYIIEFQCLYFGSYTLTYSDFYWELKAQDFEFVESKSDLEFEYVNSIVNYIRTS